MEFLVTTLNESNLDLMCIYRIWFGEKFYIGATADSFKRIVGHYSYIMEGLDGKHVGKNSVTNIVNHLRSNPHINTGYFEVLEICKDEYELVDAENEWLIHFKGNKNCLNVNYYAHRTINGVIIRPNGGWAVKKFGKYIHNTYL